MDIQKPIQQKQTFKIIAEINIEAYSAGMAAEIMQQALKRDSITEFHIQDCAPITEEPAEQADNPLGGPNTREQIINLLRYFKDQGTLVRLSVIKNRGGNLSIPCRILNFDDQRETLSIYHVDEKKVYCFSFNEVDDFSIS